jgi:hypothetical protein
MGMKNTEIHTGFDQKEVRDFLAKQMSKSQKPRKEKKRSNPNSMSTFDWAIESAERVRDLAINQIRDLETRKAIRTLILNMGWEEYDPSDHVDLDTDMYWGFVGTEEEYGQLLKNIEDE